ncbi:SDR family NAD(P)-dependent oxidoreductase [Xanthomonas campestris]|uniref:SDR family NAD(P)-dependent oxidoreductase n=1 Tax=Xanthomonas campestris TaxID=339 RepID=UPI001F30DD0B
MTGASSGIGEATAERLANAGYTVYGTSRRGGTSTTAGVQMLALDVTDDASVAAAVDTILRKEGRLDLLVNNAGFSVAASAAEESSIQQAQSVFDTNFFGTLRMTNAVIGQMRKQGGGRILNIGSVLGLVPIPYAALYVASKHAIEGYTESLDHELRDWGIRVSVIEPPTPGRLSTPTRCSPIHRWRSIRHCARMWPRTLRRSCKRPMHPAWWPTWCSPRRKMHVRKPATPRARSLGS